jgi:hypothetical protein
MRTIGFMLNIYDEHGPENIAVFPPDADLRNAVLSYVAKHLVLVDEGASEIEKLNKWLTDANHTKNEAQNLSSGWGGVQITELAVE